MRRCELAANHVRFACGRLAVMPRREGLAGQFDADLLVAY